MEPSSALRGRAARRGIVASASLAAVTLVLVLLSACQSVPVGPSITVYNQKLQLNYYTVYRAFSDGPGWLVLYNDNKGKPGEIISETHIPDGVTYDVRLMGNDNRTTPVMYVILHADMGKIGVFEYPGPDEPVSVNGRLVISSFMNQEPYKRSNREFQ
jgi:hypothetical protein